MTMAVWKAGQKGHSTAARTVVTKVELREYMLAELMVGLKVVLTAAMMAAARAADLAVSSVGPRVCRKVAGWAAK